MSVISGILGNNYQLSSLLAGKTSTGSSGVVDATSSLLQALAGGGSSSPGSSNAYDLTLSAQAQQLLAGYSASSASSESGSFLLTQEQQDTIASIVQKYKDAPFTQETFESLQQDLQAAGLSAQTLAVKDQVNGFNPTSVLIQAMSGTSDASTQSLTSADAEQSKMQKYLQAIVNQWQSVSSTAGK